MRKVWAAGGERLRWQVGNEGGVLERDARAAGGEAGEKADGQAGEARARAEGMGRDRRGGTAGLAFTPERLQSTRTAGVTKRFECLMRGISSIAIRKVTRCHSFVVAVRGSFFQ